MKKLTSNEIEFIKKTGWTPTLVQMDYSKNELVRTSFKDLSSEEASKRYYELAKEYDVDLVRLYNKTCNLENNDIISLEEEATYLFYTFFTKDELVDIDNSWALNWLKDFKYYFGYRKWTESDVENSVLEAIGVYAGTREFFETPDGDIWSKTHEKD